MKKPAAKKKKAAPKQEAPQEPSISISSLRDSLARIVEEYKPTGYNRIDTLFAQSAQDMTEINDLKKRLSRVEELNRSYHMRLSSLDEFKIRTDGKPQMQSVDMAHVKKQLLELGDLIGSMQRAMPTVFLLDWEVRKLRKVIAAMV